MRRRVCIYVPAVLLGALVERILQSDYAQRYFVLRSATRQRGGRGDSKAADGAQVLGSDGSICLLSLLAHCVTGLLMQMDAIAWYAASPFNQAWTATFDTDSHAGSHAARLFIHLTDIMDSTKCVLIHTFMSFSSILTAQAHLQLDGVQLTYGDCSCASWCLRSQSMLVTAYCHAWCSNHTMPLSMYN